MIRDWSPRLVTQEGRWLLSAALPWESVEQAVRGRHHGGAVQDTSAWWVSDIEVTSLEAGAIMHGASPVTVLTEGAGPLIVRELTAEELMAEAGES